MNSDKISVCLANDSFPPTIDGVANAVVNYAKIINNQLGRAIVATPRYPDVKDDFDFPVVRYSSIDTTKLVGYRTGNPLAPIAISKIKDFGIDIIHSHCPMISTFLSRSLRDICGVPIVFTYHTKFDIDIENAVSSNLVREYALNLLIQNIEACDEIWVVSKGAGKNLESLGYQGGYKVVENGVDFSKGRAPQEKINEIRTKCAAAPGIPTFIFVGRMMWYKGIRIILDGLRKLKNQNILFKMIFVGDGADKKEIEAYAESLDLDEDCVFVGAVRDRDMLRAYYCAADLFLFPSTFDTNGIVVREAAACELPSVLIRGSSAAEGIDDGETGLLIDENSDSMASVLKTAVENRVTLSQIGTQASEKIYISWEDSVKNAYSMYEGVIESYKSGKRKAKLSSRFDFYSVIPELKSGMEKAKQNRLEFGSSLKRHYDSITDYMDRYL